MSSISLPRNEIAEEVVTKINNVISNIASGTISIDVYTQTLATLTVLIVGRSEPSFTLTYLQKMRVRTLIGLMPPVQVKRPISVVV